MTAPDLGCFAFRLATTKNGKALNLVRLVQIPHSLLLEKSSKGKFEPPRRRRVRSKGKSYYYIAHYLSPKETRAEIAMRCYIEVKRVANRLRSRYKQMVRAGTVDRCGRRP